MPHCRCAFPAGAGWMLLPMVLAPLTGCAPGPRPTVPLPVSPALATKVESAVGAGRGDRHSALAGAATQVTPAGEIGEASWYGAAFAGRPTASGAPFDPEALTAAHPELPFGTAVTVVNLDNGRRVEVVINDRGPFVAERIIDLSRAAARLLGFLRDGIARVRVVPAESRA